MKTLFFPPALEILEARIAPASLTFHDAAGDLVTIATSKGTNADLQAAATFAPSGVGQVLQELLLSGNPSFEGTNLAITAPTAAAAFSVGYVNAAGLHLGTVNIAADLGRIDGGGMTGFLPAVQDLEIGSLAVNGVAAQGASPSTASHLTGPIGTLHIHGDLDGSLSANGSITHAQIDGSIMGGADAASGLLESAGNIATLQVKHSVAGGAGAGSGSIAVVGAIKTLTIGGDLAGGTGASAHNSGSVGALGGLGTVHILGSLKGSSADNTGQLLASAMNSVTIDGSIVGGDGMDSGAILSSGLIKGVHILHSITGGTGISSGAIRSSGGMGVVLVNGDLQGGSNSQAGIIASAGPLGLVLIDGGVTGGSGFETAAIGSSTSVGVVGILGDLVGGAGQRSGVVVSGGPLGAVSVGGSLRGGGALESGAIGALGAVGQITIKGDVVGGIGNASGVIRSATNISSILIEGSLNGGGGNQSGQIDAQVRASSIVIHGNLSGGAESYSGSILCGAIGAVSIGGNVTGFTQPATPALQVAAAISPAQVATFGSGSIDAYNGSINSVTIAGSLVGGDGQSSGYIATFQANAGRGSIGNIHVHGDITGGAGADSGKISTAGNLQQLIVGGSLRGGSGGYDSNASALGQIFAGGVISSANIAGNVLGGDSPYSAEIRAGSITRLEIGTGPDLTTGNVFAGAGTQSASIVAESGSLGSIAIAGTVRSNSDGPQSASILASLKIGNVSIGSVLGAAGEPVMITAGGALNPATQADSVAIGSVVIHGNLDTANILAGYDINGKPVNGNVSIGSVVTAADVISKQLGFIESTNIIAGALGNSNGAYGSRADQVIGAIAAGITPTITLVKAAGGFGTVAQDVSGTFGIDALHVVQVISHTTNVGLKPGPQNDYTFVGASTTGATYADEQLFNT